MTEYSERYNTSEKLVARREYMKKYMAEKRRNKKTGYTKTEEKDYRYNLRKKVFETLGGAKCTNCGCDIMEILEINHIHGGGRIEYRKYKGNQKQFHRDIISGKLDKSKYNVLCKVCNTLHYIKDLKGIKGHEVIWTSNDC